MEKLGGMCVIACGSWWLKWERGGGGRFGGGDGGSPDANWVEKKEHVSRRLGEGKKKKKDCAESMPVIDYRHIA